MLVPISWLKDYVDINISPHELSKKLVACGFEIEGIIDFSEKVKNVFSCIITTISKHPETDKLRVCEVNVGNKGVFFIVTNDLFLKEGNIVPVALNGAKLYDSKIIFSCKIKNVHSDGMFCGLSEIGCSKDDFPDAKDESVLILPDSTPIGVDINEIIGRNDILLDISITANRTDANSILGIAREIAAVTNQKIKFQTKSLNALKKSSNLSINIENNDLCKRYVGVVIEDVVVTQSPDIIKNRLRSVGIKPLNNIVDITNYVLIAVGQPMHAFDMEKINGNTILVRTALKGEKIVALNSEEYILNEDNLLIADTKKPLAIAGIMGGSDTAISKDTKTVIFESANFARDNVRQSSRSLGLNSDSSARFEKGVDIFSQELGMMLALELLEKYKWGKVVSYCDVTSVSPFKKIIAFKICDIEKILGLSLSEEQVINSLTSLGFNINETNCGFEAIVPKWREDIVGINDLAEEVIRIIGFDELKAVSYKEMSVMQGAKTDKQNIIEKMKNILVGSSASEIVTYSFINPKFSSLLNVPSNNLIYLQNPLSEDFSVMRNSLVYSMLKTVSSNYNRGNKRFRLFELANIYIPTTLPLEEDLPVEKQMLCIAAVGDDFYNFKSILDNLFYVLRIQPSFVSSNNIPYLHPYRSADIFDKKTGDLLGFLGEINTSIAKELDVNDRIYIAELDIDKIASISKNFSNYEIISKYQMVERDIAVLLSCDIRAENIIDTIKNLRLDNLIDAYIFDIYQGIQVEKGYKSIAIKLKFQNMLKTLRESEINEDIKTILNALYSNFQAKLRDNK